MTNIYFRKARAGHQRIMCMRTVQSVDSHLNVNLGVNLRANLGVNLGVNLRAFDEAHCEDCEWRREVPSP